MDADVSLVASPRRAEFTGQPAGNHPPLIRAAHWVTVALIVGAYTLAWSRHDGMPRDQAVRLLMLHRSVGVTIFLLTWVRLGVRARARLPDWPADMPAWQQFAAKASEWALYACLVAMPLLGLSASLLRGNLVLFGIAVPQLMAADRQLSRQILAAHGAVALALLGLIALHVAAALQHHFIRRDDVLLRMLPALRRGKATRRN